MSDTLQRVQKTIREVLGVKEEEIVPTAHFINDLGADSLDHVELIMALEEDFDIEIPDEQADKLNTVQDVIDLLNAHVPAVH